MKINNFLTTKEPANINNNLVNRISQTPFTSQLVLNTNKRVIINRNNPSSTQFTSDDSPFKLKHIKSTLPDKFEAYTVSELAKAPLYTQFDIDERGFFQFYWYEIKTSHELLNLFFYNSILNPFHIRITILVISLSMRIFFLPSSFQTLT